MATFKQVNKNAIKIKFDRIFYYTLHGDNLSFSIIPDRAKRRRIPFVNGLIIVYSGDSSLPPVAQNDMLIKLNEINDLFA